MNTYNGVDFVFISDEEPTQVINRFMRDHNLQFDQEVWEYPWSVEDNSPATEFSSFDSILEHVLSHENPEYAFYPKGELSCWFGVAKDRCVVFGVQYLGEHPETLAEFANRYGGKFGFVSVIDAPDLEGIKSFQRSGGAAAHRFDDFVLIDPDWVYENCNHSKTAGSGGFLNFLFGKLFK